MKHSSTISFLIAIILSSVSLKAVESDTVCFAKYHVKDTYNKIEVGDFESSSIDFNPTYTSTQALLRIFYTKKDGSSLQGQYSIAINIKNFKGKGTYILGLNLGRWRTGNGSVSGIYDGQTGTITIDNYDAANKVIAGSFSISTSVLVNGTVTQTFDISNGKFRTGRTFILKDYHKNPIKEMTFTLFKPNNIDDENLGDFTTDTDGKIYFSQNNGLVIGDPFYFLLHADTVKAVKASHQDVDDIKYQVTLDDIKINSKGQVTYDTLKNSPNIDTLKIIHTTILPNLVVSVEWDAKPEYLATVERWLRDMSNYYYNLSNGQFYINKISIYDNGVHFEDADLQIFANNMVWSAANPEGIDYPTNTSILSARTWYGGPTRDRNYSWKNDWMTTTSFGRYINSRTFAHELGHYFFGFYDEYWDENRQYIFDDYNFGFMDSQYESADEYKNEMSNSARYPDPSYNITAQYVLRLNDCWGYFKYKYQSYQSKIFYPILTPNEMQLPAGKNYLPGPNLDMDNLDKDVGASMNIKINDVDTDAGDYLLDFSPEIDAVTTDIEVYLLKVFGDPVRISKMLQGRTSMDGKIRILGAKINDRLKFNGTYKDIHNKPQFYNGFKTIDALSLTKKNEYDVPSLIFNNKNNLASVIDSKFAAVPVWKYNNQNGFTYNLYSNLQYSQQPDIEMNLPKDSSKTYVLEYKPNSKFYTVDINDSLPTNGINWQNFYDDTKNQFFASIKHRIFNQYLKQISSIDNSAFVYVDSLNININKFAFFSTIYPALTNGLDTNAVKASDVHCFVSSPDLDANSKNYLTINYDESDMSLSRELSLRIFKWNETEDKWNIIGGSVDTSRKQVSCKINSTGTYCVFTSNALMDVNENQNIDDNFIIFPNPAQDKADIRFSVLNDDTSLKLTLNDMLGNQITTLAQGFYNSGIFRTTLDLKGVAAGSYFIKLETGSTVVSKLFQVIK